MSLKRKIKHSCAVKTVRIEIIKQEVQLFFNILSLCYPKFIPPNHQATRCVISSKNENNIKHHWEKKHPHWSVFPVSTMDLGKPDVNPEPFFQ